MKSNSEKIGGNLKPDVQLNAFKDIISECDFIDFPIEGPFFTWSRGSKDNITFERLDRALANEAWWSLFPEAKEVHLIHNYSYHCPSFITAKRSKPCKGKRKANFRFEDLWTNYEGCKNTVTATWNRINPRSVKDVADTLELSGKDLKFWSNKEVGNISHTIKIKEDQLANLLKHTNLEEVRRYITTCKKELSTLMSQEETLWRQRSKCLWLKQGDKNSKYFHRTVSARKNNNTIKGVNDDQGNWLEGDDIFIHSI